MKNPWPLKFIFLLATIIVTAQVDDSKLLISSTSNGKEEASNYAQLLQEAYQEGEYERYKIYSDSLLLIAQLYDIGDMGVMAINSQAIYYKNKGNKEKAIALYYQALDKTKNLPNSQGPKAMILVNMGNIYTDIGAYEKSIATLEELLIITDTVRSFSKIKAAALIGQSTNYKELGQYEKGLEYSNKALELAEYMQEESAAGPALNNLSDIYIAQKEYKKALEAAEKGLLLKITQKPTKSRGWLLLNKGIALYHLSQFENAFKSLRESAILGQQKELPLIQMYSYEYLAKVYEQEGDFKKSFKAQKEYSRIKNFIEEDEKNAALSDVKQDVKTNKAYLAQTKGELNAVRKNQKEWILYGAISIITLLGGLLFFTHKKRVMERENKDLREKYKSLTEVIESANQSNRLSQHTTQDCEKPYKNSSLTESHRQLHKQRILQVMRLEKPYLNPDLRLSEIAKQLDLSTAHFSEILHYGFKENFHNFINFYRVVEAQELMKEEKYKNSKVIAIAFDAGFKSKTTFNRVFKNYTGLTPSEYRKTL